MTPSKNGEGATESLIDSLRQDEARERWEAAEALGRVATPAAVDALVQALSDEHPFVRWHAGQALGRIASRARRRRAGMSLFQSRQPEVQIFALTESLLPLTEDPRGYVRAAAADALGELGLASGLAMLVHLLSDSDDEVRASAAVALGKLGSDKAIGALLMLLGDENSSRVRRSAIEALGSIGGSDAIRALTVELGNPDAMIRAAAAAALGHCQGAGVTKALIGALEDGDSQVRWQAACALGIAGEITAVPYLERLRDDGMVVFDTRVGDVALEAARLIRRRHRGLWNTTRRLLHSIRVAIRNRLKAGNEDRVGR